MGGPVYIRHDKTPRQVKDSRRSHLKAPLFNAPVLTYWQARNAFLAMDGEDGNDFFEEILEAVTLTEPDLDRVRNDPWPGVKTKTRSVCSSHRIAPCNGKGSECKLVIRETGLTPHRKTSLVCLVALGLLILIILAIAL